VTGGRRELRSCVFHNLYSLLDKTSVIKSKYVESEEQFVTLTAKLEGRKPLERPRH
jgi:hypothetical protein